MIFAVSSFVEVSINKIALWISVGVDDRTAIWTIIASNQFDYVLLTNGTYWRVYLSWSIGNGLFAPRISLTIAIEIAWMIMIFDTLWIGIEIVKMRRHKSFCGATDTPVLNIWWPLP